MAERSVAASVARVVRWVCALLGAALAVHLAWVWSGHGDGSPLHLWSSWALIEIILLTSAVLVGLRCVLMPSQRVAWALIGAVAAFNGAGYVVWDRLLSSGDPLPSFSLADAFWLPPLPLLGIAVWMMSRPLVGGVGAVRVWDAVVAGTLGAAVMALVLGRSVLNWTGASPLDAIVTLGYPALTMVLVGMIGSIAALAGWRLDARWRLLSATVLVFAVANGLVSRVLADGGGGVERVDQLAGVIGLLLAAAAWQRSRRMADRPLDLWTLLAPLVCAASAVIVLAVGALTEQPPVAEVLAAVCVLAALVRVGFGIRVLLDAGEQQRLAITDELTGLYNRRGFLRGVEEALAADTRRTHAILLLDLDRFKEVNDGLGHQVGDQLLSALAPRLAGALGPDDLLARLGGDEFAVLTAHGELEQLAERLLAAVRSPLPVGGIVVPTDVSIGIAVEGDTPAGRTVGERTLELLRCADTAMYRAKTERRGWVRYDSLGPDRQRDSLERASELRAMLTGATSAVAPYGDLELHYQALVAADVAAPPRVEALVRWCHPLHGMIAPDQFLGLAERTGLTPFLTRRVLGLALDQAARWGRVGPLVQVSVNLAASDLLHPTLVEEILDGLATRGLSPSTLTVEITEQVAIGDLDTGRDVLAALRRAGVGVAIDDFGTGYSALSYLQRLPATELKLDRSLTAKLDDPAAAAIARACIDLAHTLGLEVVAEGVETPEQSRALVAAGADRLQGWLFGKAQPGGTQPPVTTYPLVSAL
ncbi:putative bifunctional diguanylate cyclase/phosphodiesterase [Cryptosporangium japonicum]|uniref:Cyclic Di-GMP phosphodiesterase RmdB n=1 Tax=Cryptosporangium japonicum TaxID=80872 RepID=A0ABP3EFS6_9ACTN